MSDEIDLKQACVQAGGKLKTLQENLEKVLYGQSQLIEAVLIGILSGGHILLEGLPGLGKTTLIKGLSQSLHLKGSRVQFTPDLLPGDITGNPMLQEEDGVRRFVFQPGPLFANIVLADEINRASPKTQSALLEAMQEGSVTVMGESHALPQPFFVMATQNPIELEGTYPLPEAQLDRFLFKIVLERNPVEVLEKIILNREVGVEPKVDPVLEGKELVEMIQITRKIHLPAVVANYIARLVHSTFPGECKAAEGVVYGASPRAGLALAGSARARALMKGRPHASFEDVQAVAPFVLGHRIILDYSAKLEGVSVRDVVEKLLVEIPVQPHEDPHSLQSAKVR